MTAEIVALLLGVSTGEMIASRLPEIERELGRLILRTGHVAFDKQDGKPEPVFLITVKVDARKIENRLSA